MTDKPKPKNDEQGFWSKLTDIILLAKSFEFEVGWLPEECAEYVKKLVMAKSGFVFPVSREVKVSKRYGQSYDFEICAKRYERGITYNTTKATGRILVDNGIEKTIVRGKVRFGIAILILPLGILLGIIIEISSPPPNLQKFIVINIVFFLIIYLLYLLPMVSDYRKLNTLLHDIFSPDEKKKKNDETE